MPFWIEGWVLIAVAPRVRVALPAVAEWSVAVVAVGAHDAELLDLGTASQATFVDYDL
jgi:hypothetical protein